MSTPTPVECYRCATCGDLFVDKGMAEQCCVCPECHQIVPKEDLPKHYKIGAMHRACADARSARIAREVQEKAEKLETWDGPVVWGDRFFPSLGEMVEHLEDTLEPTDPWPEWAETCDVSPFPKLSMDSVISDLGENHGIDDFDPWDHVSKETADLLRQAEAAFNKDLEGNDSWWGNPRRLVRMPPRPAE